MILALLVSAVLFLSAFVQLNDPDPVVWTLIYAVPALASLVHAVAPQRLPACRMPLLAHQVVAAYVVTGSAIALVQLGAEEQAAAGHRPGELRNETLGGAFALLVSFLLARQTLPSAPRKNE